MPQNQDMPDDLRGTVQNMIDGGRSKDEILSVINAYRSGGIKTSTGPSAAGPSAADVAMRKDQESKFTTSLNPNQDQIPTSWGSGFMQSLLPSGEAFKAGMSGLGGYAKGAIADLPAGLYNSAKTASDFVSNPLPTSYKILHDIGQMPSQVYNAASQSGTNPADFGRVMGQMTGQAPLTEAMLAGFPAGSLSDFGIEKSIPSGIKAGAQGIRASGPTVESLGNKMAGVTDYIPPYTIPKTWRWGGNIVGGALSKIGQKMGNFGLSADQINANAINDFWGGPSSTSGPSVSPDPSVSSGGSDIWDQVLRERARNLFNSPTPENPLTSQFNRPIPQGTDLGFKPATAQEPHLPFEPQPEPTTQGQLLEDPEFKPNPRLAKIKQYTISEPTPLKIAEGMRNGFEPAGPLVEGQPLKMVRTPEPTQQSLPTPQQSQGRMLSTDRYSPPDIVSTKGLKSVEIQALKDEGYEPGGIGADGFAQLKKGKPILRPSAVEEPPSPVDESPYGSKPEDAHQSPYGDDYGIEGDDDPDSPIVSFPNSGLALSDPNHPLNLGPRAVESTDVPSQQTGQGQLFPMEMRRNNQLENISNANDFELTPPPESGANPNQGQLNLEMDPRSTDPNQLSFPRRQFTGGGHGLRMEDIDMLGRNLKESGEPAHFLGRSYAQNELEKLRNADTEGGPPGLSVTDDGLPSANIRSYVMTYRNSRGQIIGHAKMSNVKTGFKDPEMHVGTFVIDENAGMAQGKAALEMIKKMKELGVVGANGMYSRYTAHLAESLKRFTDDYPPDYAKPEDAPEKPPTPKKRGY